MSELNEPWMSQQMYSQSQDNGYHSYGRSSLPLNSPLTPRTLPIFNHIPSMPRQRHSNGTGNQSQNNFSSSWSSGMSRNFSSQPPPLLSYQGVGDAGKIVSENEVRVRYSLHAMLTVIKSLPNKMQEVLESNPEFKGIESKKVLDAIEKMLQENISPLKTQLDVCVESSAAEMNFIQDLFKKLTEVLNDMKCLNSGFTFLQNEVDSMKKEIASMNAQLKKLPETFESIVYQALNKAASMDNGQSIYRRTGNTRVPQMKPLSKNYTSQSPVAWVTPLEPTIHVPTSQFNRGRNDASPIKLDILDFCSSSQQTTPDISPEIRKWQQQSKDSCLTKLNEKKSAFFDDDEILFSRPLSRKKFDS